MSIFAKRLKEARRDVGWSQERLGIETGLEEASASARMNRYELGKRAPNSDLVQRLATVLNMPVSYFYATDDDEALLLVMFHRMKATERQKVLDTVRGITQR
jgi:transcriptional regulator with XRE-family HTH domain